MASPDPWELNVDYKQFPPLQCCLAYGSGVFRQEGYAAGKRPMVDLLLIVEDEAIVDWHRENLSRHPWHYSGLCRAAGAGATSALQRWGPGVLFLPEVQIPCTDGSALHAKYGVITAGDLSRDLETWSSLYIAGRMQKPCRETWLDASSGAKAALEARSASSRKSALAAALLSVERGQADAREVLAKVVELSYLGDIRVGLAENPRKVQNIVDAQRDLLWSIYQPLARELDVDISEVSGALPALRFDASDAGRRRLFSALPPAIQQQARARAPTGDPGGAPLRHVLRSTVRRASMEQAVKGVLSSGVLRSARYALRKVAKRLR